MKKKFIKNAATFLVTAFAFISCNKEIPEAGINKNDIQLNNVTSENIVESSCIIDSIKQEWHFSLRTKKLSKGMMINETEYYSSIISDLQEIYGKDYKLIDTLKFAYKGINYEIKLLRVDRKSEPGKYFYVMIDNLDVKLDTACWVYSDNEKYAKKYGRLYSWYSANAFAKEITMRLPVYDKSNPTQKKLKGRIPPMPVKARLISRKDICDIIECDAIGHLPENGYSLESLSEHYMDNLHAGYPLFYYDVFVGGLDGPNDDNNNIEYFRGEHSLGGGRGGFQQPEWTWPYYDGNGWYHSLNKEGYFLTNDSENFDPSEACEVIRIIKDDENNYSVFINGLCHHQGAISVRYVFEPQYK
ncbi:MAG: hypothetical protein IKR41_07420 [Bacteroidales bacterium]|nr:hypothetical protein [Bacteroidales bacterium]